MKSLDEISRSLPEEPLAECEVDISAFFGQPRGDSVLRFREPDTAALFRVPTDAAVAITYYPEWPETLATSVAMLALSHVAPLSDKPIAEFYARLAENNRRIFLYVMNAYKAAFPHLADFQGAVQEEKKD